MSLIILSVIALVVVGAVATFAIALLLRRVVPTNEVHIVQTSKNTVPFGKGLEGGNTYYAWPSWLPKLGLSVTVLPVSNFDIRLDEYEAYDKERVPFLVDVVAFFRILHASTAAERVSTFDELIKQLEVIVQGAVRTVLANEDINSIMLERAKFGKQFTEEVEEQLKNWGVEPVKSIELMDLRDSKGSAVIQNIMAVRTSEIEKESRVAVANNKRAGQIAEIDAKREIDLQQQQAEEAVGKRTAEKDRAVGIERERSIQEVAQEQRVTAERQQEVRRVTDVKSAEIARDVAIVNAEEKQRTQVIAAEAKREADVIAADGQKQQTVKVAEGQMEAKKFEAQGIEAEGNARAAAETAILQAPVTAQITLAKEIGTNPGYQEYLIRARQVEAIERVGVANSEALKHADIKVIANTGEGVPSGISGIGDLFSSKGGQHLGAMLEGLVNTPAGRAVLERATGAKLSSDPEAKDLASMPGAVSTAESATV